MAAPLLFRPAPKWQIFAALGGAIFIHLAAVALAFKKEPPPVDVAVDLQNTVEAVIETQAPEEIPTPPPEDIPMPPPPPDITEIPEFHEESPPPKQITKPATKVQPIKAPQTAGPRPTAMGAAQGKAAAVFAPRPEYPYEAKRTHVTGSGVCVVTVDPATGSVTDATMAQSTGSSVLDNATTSAFRRWRFKAGVVSKVRIPITFTLTGASY